MERLLSNPIFLIFAFPLIVSLVGTLAYYWHKARRDEIDAALKQDMLQRGMSADDIVKVLNASNFAREDSDEDKKDPQTMDHPVA